MTVVVTGGCGFIGSEFIFQFSKKYDEPVINIDCVTYAASPKTVEELAKLEKYQHLNFDIKDRQSLEQVFEKYQPRLVVNFAAESHVDNSIKSPSKFVTTNIVGTSNLLDISLKHWNNTRKIKEHSFRLLQISTDEVYGSLGPQELPFTEKNNILPNSPYSASKAAADQLVRAYNKTYGLPTLISHCSNNYGPRQHSEKLIPMVINNAIQSKQIPIYGDGQQVRDWLHVKDHCAALMAIITNGNIGEKYNIGGNNEIRNIDLVSRICDLLDLKQPLQDRSYSDLICFVKDRLGHDIRYAVNSSKIQQQLSWAPKIDFDNGLSDTVDWYTLSPQG